MNRLQSRFLRARWVVLALWLLAPRGMSHDGPPYPILVDEDLSGWVVSVWADPDVGEGTFYYYIDSPEGRSPMDVRLHVESVPVDGLSPPVEGESVESEPGEPFQQIGLLDFDHRGLWETRFELLPADSGGAPIGELTYELSVTPPGLGSIDLLWFAFPFLAFAGLWIRVLFAKRAQSRALSSAPSTNS